MPRVLGLDFGSRRIGVALSDVMGITACPFTVIDRQSNDKTFEELGRIIKDQDVTLIVLGDPLNMDGSHGIITEDVKAFARKLEEKFNVGVKFMDERLTSLQAERILEEEADYSRAKRKGLRDKVAAALILQSYLDSIKIDM
jgi:putative Holliday junction resolvase